MAALLTTLTVRRPAYMADEAELISSAKAGDPEAFEGLLRQYEWLVRARARSFFLQGAEYEDLIQEGMIGLLKAVRDFRYDGASFRSFAELCVTRQILTAVKTASRMKHFPLNSSFSIESPRFQYEDGRKFVDALPSLDVPFDAALIQTDEVRAIIEVLRRYLSPFEFRALILWLEGRSYADIGRQLGKHVKSVDNGLWRVKCKVRRLLDKGLVPGSL